MARLESIIFDLGLLTFQNTHATKSIITAVLVDSYSGRLQSYLGRQVALFNIVRAGRIFSSLADGQCLRVVLLSGNVESSLSPRTLLHDRHRLLAALHLRKASRHDFTAEVRIDSMRLVERVTRRVQAFARCQIAERFLVSPRPLPLHVVERRVHHQVLTRI